MAAPAVSCAILLTLHMADDLLNAMINPLFICIMGGLGALCAQSQMVQPRGFEVVGPRTAPGNNGGRRIMPPPPNRPVPRPTAYAAR
jgi:hypothetical protein